MSDLPFHMYIFIDIWSYHRLYEKNVIILLDEKVFFFIMYFSLPDSIPPRPLGEERVRTH
jgi:hypothetical protein